MTNFKNTMDWMKLNGFFAVIVKDEDNSYFSPVGCDADPESLGNNVYDCSALGLDGKHYDCHLCHEAVCYIVNGED